MRTLHEFAMRTILVQIYIEPNWVTGLGSGIVSESHECSIVRNFCPKGYPRARIKISLLFLSPILFHA